jgi:superfamily II DNA helicase RecQ
MTTDRQWTDEEIRTRCLEVFGLEACLWQIRIAQAILKGNDVIGVAATGAGKTLSFWLALLMTRGNVQAKKCIIVVTPLNVLGQQNEDLMLKAGISAIAISSENNNEATFLVCKHVVYDKQTILIVL